jgi:hypothetical protein
MMKVFTRPTSASDFFTHNISTIPQPPLKAIAVYRFKFFAIFHHLDWIDAPHTQNLEILKSVEKTQESKNLN